MTHFTPPCAPFVIEIGAEIKLNSADGKTGDPWAVLDCIRFFCADVCGGPRNLAREDEMAFADSLLFAMLDAEQPSSAMHGVKVLASTPLIRTIQAGARFSSCGRFLYAANETTDSIVQFEIDPQTGKLQPTAQSIKTGSPVCTVFGSYPAAG